MTKVKMTGARMPGMKARKVKAVDGSEGGDHGLKREVLDRLMRIHEQIEAGKYPNCSTIARDFGVSLKTAARDLDFMRDNWRFPMDYDKQRHGFFYWEKVLRLPWVRLTGAELFSVVLTKKLLEVCRGISVQQPLEQALSKMTQNLNDAERGRLERLDQAYSVWIPPCEGVDLDLLELATRATADRQGLRFRYRKPGQNRTEMRSVHPYHVDAFDWRVYVQAYDPHRGAERRFALDRMSEPELTGEKFEKPKDFDPKKAFSSSLSVMSGQGDHRVAIEMDAWLTDILNGRRLHDSQEVVRLPGGGAHLRLRLSCLDLIEQEVLGWGTHATVIEPVELRERVGRIGKELAEKYGAEEHRPQTIDHRPWTMDRGAGAGEARLRGEG